MSRKKIWSYLGKIVKWILWILLLGALLFLIIGYAKFDGGVQDYTRYLNQKDWNEAVSQVEILDVSSYGSLFWAEETGAMITGTGFIVEIDEVEELDIDLGEDELDADADNVDVFDPEFADDFESFFAEESVDLNNDEDEANSEETSDDTTDLDGFGFVNNDTGTELSGDIEDE